MRLNVAIGNALQHNETGLVYYSGFIQGEYLTICHRDGTEFETLHEWRAESEYSRLFNEPTLVNFKYTPKVLATKLDDDILLYKGERYVRI